MKIRYPAGCPLIAGVELITSWLFVVENGRVYYCIWLEQSSEQVVSDFAIFEIRCKTRRGRRVGSLDVLYQKIEVLKLRIMVIIVFESCLRASRSMR